MNFDDMQPAPVDVTILELNRPTVTVSGTEYDIDTLAAAKGIQVRQTFDQVVVASKHNADLLEALESGTDFRIAFKKPGESDFTRVRVADETPLQAAAIEEITERQAGIMENFAALLGVDNFALDI